MRRRTTPSGPFRQPGRRFPGNRNGIWVAFEHEDLGYLMRTHFLGVCALILIAGCAAESPPTKTIPRDSAGVQIVESSAPEWDEGSGWVVEESSLLDLATIGEGPSHEFFRVRDAMRLDDGRVVVANYGSNEIRFFSSTGEFISSVGRQGEGPGEFQRIETLSGFGADSVPVYDYWLSRVTVLGPGGGIGRVTSLRGLAAAPGP